MSATVAVVFGGPSAEAAVSQVSGQAVAQALERSGYRVPLLELGPDLPARLASERVDAVVPTTHGPLGEDGCLQGLLEVLGIPYAGAGVLGSALAAHKATARRLFEQAGLPVAPGWVVNQHETRDGLAPRLRSVLGQAVVVKPCSGGSAIGVSRIPAEAPDTDLLVALNTAFEVDPLVLVESFRLGDEVTCGVLEDEQGEPTALPPTRIVAKSADWYDFTSRYKTGGSEHQCPAPFSAALIARIQEVALGAHAALGVRDLSRVDLIVEPSSLQVTLLEVNTLPGMTPTSLFPEAAAVAGISFERLCARLAERALGRSQRPTPSVRPMPL